MFVKLSITTYREKADLLPEGYEGKKEAFALLRQYGLTSEVDKLFPSSAFGLIAGYNVEITGKNVLELAKTACEMELPNQTVDYGYLNRKISVDKYYDVLQTARLLFSFLVIVKSRDEAKAFVSAEKQTLFERYWFIIVFVMLSAIIFIKLFVPKAQ